MTSAALVVRLRRRAHDAIVDERGLGEAIQVMLLSLVVLVFVLVLVLAGRGSEARTRVEHSAESAAQAAALQRNPDAARRAAVGVATAALTNCSGNPTVAVDTGSWSPGGIVTVTISCSIPTGDLAPLPLPGSVTMTASSAAVIDTYRDQP